MLGVWMRKVHSSHAEKSTKNNESSLASTSVPDFADQSDKKCIGLMPSYPQTLCAPSPQSKDVFAAAKAGDTEKLKALLAKGSPTDFTDEARAIGAVCQSTCILLPCEELEWCIEVGDPWLSDVGCERPHHPAAGGRWPAPLRSL